MLRVGSVQFQHQNGRKSVNLDRVREFTARAATGGVRMLAFPEMCITGYWGLRSLDRGHLRALSEPVPDGPSTRALCELAAEHDIIVAAGLIEQDDDGTLYNTYVVSLPDGRVEKHRKLHCFISPYMESGSRFTVFDTPLGVKVGVLICWDNNLVENVRATALLGADILLAPHQTGGTASRSPHAMGRIDPRLWHDRTTNPEAVERTFRGEKGRGWLMRWLPARAHDNGMFLIFSNGVGLDDDEVRTGNAMILDCYGRIISETSRAGDEMVVADLDLDLLPMCTGRRWLRGRRPELYDILTRPRGDELDARHARFSDEAVTERSPWS